MSDIPLARAMLYDALEAFRLVDCKICIRAALVQMVRKTPEFRVTRHNRPMTRLEVAKAKAINGKRKGKP